MRIEQPGVTAFTQLSDVPHSFLGASLKTVSVNLAETALEFSTGGTGGGVQTIVAGTNITVDATDPANPIVSSTGGGASITETEIDFGSKPTESISVTVTDASITALSKIMITPSGNPATGRVGNDYTWENFSFSAVAAAGSFILSAVCGNGSVVGKRKVFYSFS